MRGVMPMLTACVVLSAGLAACDRGWARHPATVLSLQPISAPCAKGAAFAHVRQDARGSHVYLVTFYDPSVFRGFDEFERIKGVRTPEFGLPGTAEERAVFAFPPLFELDATAGTLVEVPWERWAAATGATHPSSNFTTWDGGYMTRVSQDKRSLVIDNTPCQLAAPYAGGFSAAPGAPTMMLAQSAFGPTADPGWLMGGSTTIPLGEIVCEWFSCEHPPRREPQAIRLVGSALATYDEALYGGRTFSWCPEGRCAIITRNGKLWVVRNPALWDSPAAAAAPAGQKP